MINLDTIIFNGEYSISDIETIEFNPKIVTTLDIRNNQLTPEEYYSLIGLLSKYPFKKLILDGNEIDDHNILISLVDVIVKNTVIECLSMKYVGIGFRGSPHLVPLLCTQYLLELNLSGNIIRDAGMKVLCQSLKINRVLRRIELSDNMIKDVGAEYLAEVLQSNSSLTMINISCIFFCIG